MFLSRKTRIPFVFFSEDQANAFSDSARRLLTWAGEEYTDEVRYVFISKNSNSFRLLF